jgi:carbonic anhydrase
MNNLDSLLERNKDFAAQQSAAGTLMPSLPQATPNLKAMIVGCADMRVDPAHVLGIKPGEALVLRNIGGRVTPVLLEEIRLLGRVGQVLGRIAGGGGEFHLIILQHTDCGITRLAGDPAMLTHYFQIQEAELKAKAVTDPHAAVAADVALLRTIPALPGTWLVSGLVYDVSTGLVEALCRQLRFVLRKRPKDCRVPHSSPGFGLIGEHTSRQLLECRHEVLCTHYIGTRGKQSPDECGMKLQIQVCATVFNDYGAIISVACLQQGREYDSTRRNTEQHNRIDLSHAKDHIQIGSGKCAYPALGHDDVIGLRSQRGVNRSGRALKKFLVRFGSFDGAEQLIAIAHLGQIRSESDLNVNHRHPRIPRRVQNIGSSGDDSALWFGVDGNDAVLAIHRENSRMPRIKCNSHGRKSSRRTRTPATRCPVLFSRCHPERGVAGCRVPHSSSVLA